MPTVAKQPIKKTVKKSESSAPKKKAVPSSSANGSKKKASKTPVKKKKKSTKPSTTSTEKQTKPTSKILKVSTNDRKVLYPEPSFFLCSGKSPLTAEKSKELLGWREETDTKGMEFGSDFLLRDLEGKKIRCINNLGNRPFDGRLAKLYTQELLNRRWKLNGETIIIGKTGLILSAQHRLVALVLAVQEWEKHPGKWKPLWDSEPTMDTFVVKGIDEDDDTVNSLDVGKPRSLSDVLYRSALLSTIAKVDRVKVAKMLEYAIKFLWHRTGAKENAFAPLRTHSESIDFVERHPKLVEVVEHIFTENGDGEISKSISPGYAAGLLYLMGSSKTKQDKEGHTDYQKSDHPNESSLDWSLYDRASEFFVYLAQRHKDTNALRESLGRLINGEVDPKTNEPIVIGEGGSYDERVALLIKAWTAYSTGKKITPTSLKLEYEVDGEGVSTLVETPTCGGIDRGNAE